MTINQAFALRVREILDKKNLTQRKLEQESGILHGSMTAILNNKVNASNFKTMALIIRALGMSFKEFFDSNVFNMDILEIDD